LTGIMKTSGHMQLIAKKSSCWKIKKYWNPYCH
jgi:hypothetical protein